MSHKHCCYAACSAVVVSHVLLLLCSIKWSRFGAAAKRFIICPVRWGQAVAQLVVTLRYKPEVAGSIPDGVIGFFH